MNQGESFCSFCLAAARGSDGAAAGSAMAAPSAAESAPAASQAHAGSDNDDPLKRKYLVTRTVIGHGADGGVVRGIHNESEEWHALKYLSRGGYDPEREIEALKKSLVIRILCLFKGCSLLSAGAPNGCWLCLKPISRCTPFCSGAGVAFGCQRSSADLWQGSC